MMNVKYNSLVAGSSNFMESLDIDSLFTNIPLKETVEICTNNLIKSSDIIHGLKKTEFKNLLCNDECT